MPPSVPDLRTIEIEGAPWFHATDVCRCLGLTTKSGTSQHTMHLGADEKQTLARTRDQIEGLAEFIGNTGQAATVSESGLYKLIMRSDKDTARPFQDWVTKAGEGGAGPPSSCTTSAVLVRFPDGAP